MGFIFDFINKASFKFLNTSYLNDAKIILLGKEIPYEILKIAPQTTKVQASSLLGVLM